MNSPNRASLAVDTSAYTTSIAMVSGGQVVLDRRTMLAVPQGGRGLRQSEAVFAHVKNLRALFSGLPNDAQHCPGTFSEMARFDVSSAAFSEKPCPAEHSYMPVFCVGASHAAAYAAALGIKPYALTHQHGHLYAVFFGNDVPDGAYGAMHVSGGTLDLLRVTVADGLITEIEPVGGSLDITCGQLIDRVGVAAGLPFPAGSHMEKMYRPGARKLAVKVDGLQANLSGAETQALRRLAGGEEPEDVCSAAFDCVAETLGRLVVNAAQTLGMGRFILSGGVMAGTVIREALAAEGNEQGIGLILTQREYCGDNACGLALAAERLHDKGVLT
jgi:N6-L-threonylcarbamoyladenine synthase